MNVEIHKHFVKQLVKLKDTTIELAITAAIDNATVAKTIEEMVGIKKLKGHKTAFRIGKGDHRIGVFIVKDTVTFAAVEHRSSIHKTFP